MPLGGTVARPGAIAERDARRLLVKLQDIFVAFHPIDRPELHALAFKLDRDAHFGTRIASGNVASASTDPTNRLRRTNGRNERCGFGAQPQVLAPGVERFWYHSHDHLPLSRVESAYLFPLSRRVYLRFARNAT